MVRLKRAVVLALAVLMICGTVAGCTTADPAPSGDAPAADTPAAAEPEAGDGDGGSEDSIPEAPGGVDLSQEVALSTWLLGDTPVDNDLVYDEVNKILKEKLNTTLDINYIPWSDADTKYQLLFAAGEEFDQCYTAFWTTPVYQVLATKNAFLELTDDMLQTYAPGAYAQMPEAAWKQNRVNGKLYTFPKSARSFDAKQVVIIRGDLREKYDLPACDNLENLQLYLETIAENEDSIVPYQVEKDGGMISTIFYEHPENLAVFTPAKIMVDIDDPNQELMLMADDPRFLEHAELMKRFRDLGVIPSDAVSKDNSSGSGEAFISGKSAMFIWNVNIINAYNTVMEENPDWKPEVWDPSPEANAYPTAYRDGVAISPNSANWERCLLVQEELRNNKDLWDLTNYGISGVHWEPVGDDKYAALPDAKNFPANGSCQWGWQTEFQRVSETMPQSYLDIEDTWRANETPNYLLNGFAIDATDVKNIDAVMQNLVVQYWNPISLGAMDDPAAAIAEWKQKMEEAGLDEYFASAQQQAADFADLMR